MALIIKHGNVVTEKGVIQADVQITDGIITAIGPKLVATVEDQIVDATGKYVLPGIIDAHTHYKMANPTDVTADDFESGTKSAACGGVTTYIDYAEPIEGKTLLEVLAARQEEANGHSYLDYHLHVVVTGWHDFDYDELEQLARSGISSLKIFTTYGTERLPDDKIKKLFAKAKELGLLVTVHAEDDAIVTSLKKKFLKEGKTGVRYHAESRPNEAEEKSVETILNMAKEVEAPVYIVHVSTGEAAEIIKSSQEAGQKVLGETCPHYLLLTSACYQEPEGQKYIMTPPLRTKRDQKMLWEALRNGTFQCITTDHCAYNLTQKLRTDSCFTTLPGIPGSETLLPLIYSEGVTKGRISIEQLVGFLATNPAKIFGLYPQKGVLGVGSDGDVTILDPEKEVILTGSGLHSAAGYTPFEGIKVKGYPIMTILRGNILYQDGKFASQRPKGQFIRARF